MSQCLGSVLASTGIPIQLSTLQVKTDRIQGIKLVRIHAEPKVLPSR